ncbi:MAG: MFS transporter [Holophagales bacterium]|nr:MFS transporter [Holophagales bacterium]MYG31874.1 MFS transporter [Holophagales bacterium]MYI79716.1 MFS transporter [Holophagales bacterium]
MTVSSGTRRKFYGWPMVAVGFVTYGLGIAPAYYGLGIFASSLIADLELTRQQIGEMFGAFTFTYGLVSPVAAAVIRRWGIRATVTAGALCAASGFWLVSEASSATELYLGYSLVGGIGIGFSTLLPAQSMPVFWFRRYRARATAIILTGAAVVGFLWQPAAGLVLESWDWRVGWRIVAGLSLLVAAIAVLFIRNKPSDIGQRRDGLPPAEADDPTPVGPGRRAESRQAESSAEAAGESAPKGALMWALRTPQFWIATFATAANTVPWRVVSAHGGIHLEDLGFTTLAASAILGVRVGASLFGRLTGSLGDFMSPMRLLALALLVNAVALSVFVSANSAVVAYPCVFAIGVAYGTAYTSEVVVFGLFFGRAAFVGSTGVRLFLIGVIGAIGPVLAGAAADRTGSYAGTLWTLAALAVLGAASIWFCRPPDRSVLTGESKAER